LASGTDPDYIVDTDGDGLYDDYEIVMLQTAPLLLDTDYDGINDNVDTSPLTYIDSELGVLEYNSSGDYYIIGSSEDLIQWNKDLNNLPRSLEKLYLPKKYDKEIFNLNPNCQIIKKID
jgi:hypothetical protein